MTTTPEPAVSPAPDTDALRAYLRRTIGGDFERRLIAADLLDDDDALSVLRVFEDVVPAIEREITSRHQAFVLMLADAKAERDDRIAGLRADLDRARAERDALSRDVDRLAERRVVLQRDYARAWEALCPVVRWPAGQPVHSGLPGVAQRAADEIRNLRAQLAGARPIPDDAAERIHAVVEELCTGQDDANGGTVYFLDHHEGPQELAREVLKALGATPTTGPAPDVADGKVPIDVVRRIKVAALLEARDAARDARRLCWAENREQEVIRHWGGMAGWLATRAKAIEAGEEPDWPDAFYVTAPAAPQALAQPTEPMASCGVHTEDEAQRSIRHELCTPAAREDTAPPDEYGENVIVPNLAKPAVDGARPDCACEMGDPHPSDPDCEINGLPHARDCWESAAPFDTEES